MVALTSDEQDDVAFVTESGDVVRLSAQGIPAQVATGLKRCGFSWRVLAKLPTGELIGNDCVDRKDVLMAFGENGQRRQIATLEHNVVALAAGQNGELYVADWRSKGNLTVEFNPSYLRGADDISGQVSLLKPDGTLGELYRGGLPLSLATAPESTLVAAIWGRAGRFRPKAKEFSVADPRHLFFVALSTQIELVTVGPQRKTLVPEGKLHAVSSIVTGRAGKVFVYGISEAGAPGIFSLAENGQPTRLALPNEELHKSVTAMAASKRYLYFANRSGKIHRIRQPG